MRVPAFEAVGDHVVQLLVGECLDQQLLRLGKDRAAILHLQPLAHVVGKAVPVVAVCKHVADAIGEMRRHGHALPAVGDDAAGLGGSMDDDIRVLELLDLQAEARKEEQVAG
jgi:hypothetical protein